MSVSCPYYMTSLPIKLENDVSHDEPLDLSFKPLEKKVIQQFRDQISVQRISKNFNLNINEIYNIINKTSLMQIKDPKGKYTPDIKHRIQEAKNKGKTLKEITKIFHLEFHQVNYINRCNRDVSLKELCHIEKLKRLLCS